MERLLTIMRRLRAPDGCPWDREQTHRSLRPYLLEEAAEAVDALSSGSSEEIRDELGDVLLQVAFHAVIAEEEGSFDYGAIETAIVDKLVRRHPHVFGQAQAKTASDVLESWQALKRKEGGAPSGVPASLGALARAQALGKKRGWPSRDSAALAEALAGLEGQGEAASKNAERSLGELLLAAADYARAQGIDAELALREATRRRENALGEAGPGA